MVSLNAATNTFMQNPEPWDEQFLNWFAGLGIAMREKKLRLGTFEYFHFSCEFIVQDGRLSASFGSHSDRKTAAIKCAAEAIERMTMVEYFTTINTSYPRSICNSNGWAVHSSESAVKEKALNEAIERHLLLKTYLLSGWAGFQLIQEIESPEVNLKLLVASLTTRGIIAGMVVARSPKFKGISIGFCNGKKDNIGNSDFWQNAIFEAVDKLLILESAPFVDEFSPWLRRENNRLLCEPFDLNDCKFSETNGFVEGNIGDFKIETIDLGAQKNLGFPLYAAFARGGNLIPLFWKSALDEPSRQLVTTVLRQNGIFDIPERHPIL